uniref:Pre-mRNA splicing Prp18-interacting factor n=1 Tax=Tanacetum cinerariifolium TaxID=118510 RepID=A0A6L2KXN6_TANCI|nr:hypothetical protein [Tanacetum cinerariifolium]
MSLFNQSECLGCGQPCDGYYCYTCMCQQCGVGLTNGICFHCTYGNGQPIPCCKCEGPLRGGFCLFCTSRAETSFANDPNPISFNNFQNLSSPQPQYETYFCELCGNNSYYGYDCPPQFSLVYEQELSYNQNNNDNYYLYDWPSFLCYDNCGGPHVTFQAFYSNKEYLENSSNAIAHVLPTEEPEYSLSIGDEHLNTIPKTESDEVIKSSVENLVPIPSESEVTSKNESECDVPVNDESSSIFTTFLNPLFECNDDFTSSDDESLSNEDVPMENFKIYSNPLFDDEEIISTKIDLHYFNAESNLLESLLNHDTLIDSSPKFDYFLKEFSGELAQIDPIPPRIEEADFDLEEEIHLVENLLYDNSSPQRPEELNAEIADTIFESFSPCPIPIEDSDSQMKEIDLFLDMDDLMPPGIESDDYDSEGDILFLEEFLSNDTLPLPKNESSNFDHHDDPSFPRPPSKPLDVEIFFDFEPNTVVLIAKVVEDISVVMNNIDELNEDECFDPGRGEIDVFANVEDNDYFPSYLSFEFFYLISPTLRFLLYFSPPGVKIPFSIPTSPPRAGDITSGWKFHVL